MNTRYLYLFVLAFTVFVGCDQPMVDELAVVTEKFPQLRGNYQLVRSVSTDRGFKINLFSQPDTVEDPQRVVIVWNSRSQSYGIPFPSNTYRDYWDFEFDSILPEKEPFGTTFAEELNACMRVLNFEDTIGTNGYVVDELLYSILHCERVGMSDSAELNMILMSDYSDISEEDDACERRIEKNWIEMSKQLSGNFHKRALFLDKENSRVYEFNYEGVRRLRKNSFKVRTFRMDCVWHMMRL